MALALFALSLAVPAAPLWQAALLKLGILCALPLLLAVSGFFTWEERESAIGGAASLWHLALERWHPLPHKAGNT